MKPTNCSRLEPYSEFSRITFFGNFHGSRFSNFLGRFLRLLSLRTKVNRSFSEAHPGTRTFCSKNTSFSHQAFCFPKDDKVTRMTSFSHPFVSPKDDKMTRMTLFSHPLCLTFQLWVQLGRDLDEFKGSASALSLESSLGNAKRINGLL